MKLKFKKLHPAAVTPQYATPGAACFDLHAIISETEAHMVMMGALTFRTGLAVEVPAGHVMLIFSRSGHGFKNDVRLSNCVGVIDSDYRGELQVRLRADSTVASAGIAVRNGDRIAQAMIVPIPAVELEEVGELTDTARGAGGFGSTGA